MSGNRDWFHVPACSRWSQHSSRERQLPAVGQRRLQRSQFLSHRRVASSSQKCTAFSRCGHQSLCRIMERAHGGTTACTQGGCHADHLRAERSRARAPRRRDHRRLDARRRAGQRPARRDGKGYGPPVEPAKIVADYERIRGSDPTRPVLLNLGQGVAWDGWMGRGVRTTTPRTTPSTSRAATSSRSTSTRRSHPNQPWPGSSGTWRTGVEGLLAGRRTKIVWNCIECTRISSARKSNPLLP